MNLSGIISQLISLFLMIFAGYIIARVGIMTPEFRARLSSFTLSCVSPFAILSSVLESDTSPVTMLSAVGVALVFFFFMSILAALLVRLVRTKKEDRGWDQLMLIFTNVGFMGIPVIQSVYGADGVARLSMFILIFNPCIFGALCGLFCGVTGFHFPAVVESTMSAIGAMNTPLAMMIIGGSVAHSDVRAALSNPRLYRVSFLRMAVMPLLIMLVMLPLPFDRMLVGISVLLASMPIAGNCSMVANIYAPGDMTAAHAVIISTLASAATLPAICALLSSLL